MSLKLATTSKLRHFRYEFTSNSIPETCLTSSRKVAEASRLASASVAKLSN